MDGDVEVDHTALGARISAMAIGQPRVMVGIDGLGAAGKSTLARQLVAAMRGAHLVSVDDFYLPSSRRSERAGETGPLFDLPRLAREVVVPGAAGRALRYQRYDWALDALHGWVEVPCGAPVVVEGVYCLQAALRDAYTFRIWCKADRELRLRRGLARDGDGARSLWVDHWMPAEDAYAAKEQPEACADLVVESADPGEPAAEA